MSVTRISVAHRIGLDGLDAGPATIEIDPTGRITDLHPYLDADGGDLSAIPLLADAHMHLAISDGITEDPAFHTPDRVDAQLLHLAARGIGHVHSLGTDQSWLQDRLRRRLRDGDPGARAFGYSAGTGFGAQNGWPPDLTLPEPRFRPRDSAEARRDIRALAEAGGRTLKLWVDDLGGTVPKIPEPVIRAIADEARNRGIVTFAHVYFHVDAALLVSAGIDVLAHAVRDRPMEAPLLDAMAEKGTILVPTLSREEAELNFSSSQNPYFDNPFFLRSEHDLMPRLRDTRFSDDPEAPRTRLRIATENVSRAHAAGVAIGMGTDSGFRMKLLGFAQHRELQLLREAGLPTSACLAAGLAVNRRLFASALSPVEVGVPASFFLVAGDPTTDIRATEAIREVWVGGERLPGSASPAAAPDARP